MGVLSSLVGRAVKKAARSAGKALGHAVFGDLDDEGDEARTKKAPPPDPFAKLKAAEAEKKAKR